MIRNQAGRSWQLKLVTYVAASFATAAVTGAWLAWLGGVVSEDVRVIVATLLALVGIAYGAAQLLDRSPPLCQLDRETSQSWMDRGPLVWATLNGGALGLGFTSRLGFPLWYVVPVTAFLAASPILGAIVYGTYGVTRGAGAFLLMLANRRPDAPPASDWVLQKRQSMQLVAASYLTVLSIATVIVAGV